MLVQAWFWPPNEGFQAYARRIILTLIICFACAPFVTSWLVSLAVWLVDKDDDPRAKR
jgi:hypothetical protein